jgi:hypothetical protein
MYYLLRYVLPRNSMVIPKGLQVRLKLRNRLSSIEGLKWLIMGFKLKIQSGDIRAGETQSPTLLLVMFEPKKKPSLEPEPKL